MTISDFVNASEPTRRPDYLYRQHPGAIFKRRCLSKTNLTHAQVAFQIGISPKHLSRFINGHVNVGVDFARKLESCTNISAASWLYFQTKYDLFSTKELLKAEFQLT